MKIIPAIDLIDGACVRLTQGAYDQKTVYGLNPLEIAQKYEAAGLEYLHLVDLDGAKKGEVVNLEVLQNICKNTSLNVDFGGGITSESDLEKVLEAGAKQVTIGSLAVKRPDELKRWMKTYGPEKFILGADVKGDFIAVSGWLETSDLSWEKFILNYLEEGIQDVLCTDISKDGMLSGPSIALYESIMKRFPTIQLIASGGVANVADLKALTAAGLPKVVVGKAIYENRISLEELKANDN